jgi:hypothetical protein
MAYRRAVAEHEYLVLDLETVPDTARWSRPELPHGTEAPFPPTWAHRIIVVGCLWLGKDYRLKKLGVIGDERADESAHRSSSCRASWAAPSRCW